MMCSQKQLTKFEATGRNRNVTVIRELVNEGNSESEEDKPVLVEECSIHLGFILHTVSGVSNRWTGIWSGTVGWKMGWNGRCS